MIRSWGAGADIEAFGWMRACLTHPRPGHDWIRDESIVDRGKLGIPRCGEGNIGPHSAVQRSQERRCSDVLHDTQAGLVPNPKANGTAFNTVIDRRLYWSVPGTACAVPNRSVGP